jgi:AhpD family alkylhydroperoxidase
MMQGQRIDAYGAAPSAMKAVVGVETYIQHCGLERSLIELVKMRASQINGCAYCLDMHSKDARRNGETENGSICSTPGTTHPSTARGSGRRWPGRTR